MHTYTHVFMYTCEYMDMYWHILFVCMYINTHVLDMYICIHIYTCMYICYMNGYIDVCIYACTYVGIHVYMSLAWKRVWKRDNEVWTLHNIWDIWRGCQQICRRTMVVLLYMCSGFPTEILEQMIVTSLYDVMRVSCYSGREL